MRLSVPEASLSPVRARILIGALIAIGACAGGEANACFLLDMPQIGGKPSEAERLAREKKASADQIRHGTRKARRDLAGGVDAAAALADWTVPDIRPVPLGPPECGPMDETDLGWGKETRDDWLAGTPYAGRAWEFGEILDTYRGPGATCNAEVRDRFAAHLRRRLTSAQLSEVYVFLAGRRRDEPIVGGTTVFQGLSRRLPLLWIGSSRLQTLQVRAWLRRLPAGRALKGASDEFWAETGPLMTDPKRLCPAATANWPAAQAALVRRIEALDSERRAAAAEARPTS